MLQKINDYEKRSPHVAYVYATLGNITLVLMQVSMKIVVQTLTPFVALFIRGLLLLMINTIVVRMSQLRVDQPDHFTYKLLMKRSIFSTLALTLFMSSVAYIPIGIANSLFNTGPIIVHLLQAVYYRKTVHKINLVLTFVCFLGVLFIIKPEFLFGAIPKWPLIFMILPVFGAFSNSCSLIILHELKDRVSNLIALQYFYLGQTFFTAFLQNFQQAEMKKQIGASLVGGVGGLVCFAYLTQNLVTRAVYLKKASHIMPFGYLSILVASFTDVALFGAQFDWLSVLGMVMTSAGLLTKLFVNE